MKNLPYYIMRSIFYVISLLPFWFIYLLADVLYFLIYHVVGYRKKIVRKHLDDCFPEYAVEKRKKIEREYFRLMADYILENIKLVRISRKSMMKRMTFSGVDEIEEAMKEQPIVLVYLSHMGNWEYVASLKYWLSEDVHAAQLYHKLHNPHFDRLMKEMREQYGGECILMKDTLRRILEYKRENRKVVIGFIADQVPRNDNVHGGTMFLNHETYFASGVEKIATKLNAPVAYAELSRAKRGHYHVHFSMVTTSPKEYAKDELTNIYASMLEGSIRKDPALWLWSHRRWKRIPAQARKKQEEEARQQEK